MAKLCKLINSEGVELLPKTTTGQVDGLDTELARVKSINGISMRGNSGITIDDKYAGLRGKYVSFSGDSITTYEGYITEGYENCYYPNTVITNVNQTWWKQFLNITGMKLCANASWGGSRVTGLHSVNQNGSMGAGDTRINDLSTDSIVPDVIITLMGINDFGNNVPIGDWKGGEIPADGEITTFSEGYALMLYKMLTKYPYAEIFVCTLPEAPYDDDIDAGTFPCSFTDEDGNEVTLYDYNETIRMIARIMGVNVIDMHACGISYWGRGSYLIEGLHPSQFGMSVMARKAVTDVVAQSIYTTDTDYTVVDGTWYVNPGWRWLTNECKTPTSSFKYINEATIASICNVPINALKIAVAQEGTFAYGKLDAEGNRTALGTINLTNPSTVPQVFMLPETIVLGEGENLSLFGTDTSGNGSTGSFFYGNGESNTDAFTFASGSTFNLSIGIGYIDNA